MFLRRSVEFQRTTGRCIPPLHSGHFVSEGDELLASVAVAACASGMCLIRILKNARHCSQVRGSRPRPVRHIATNWPCLSPPHPHTGVCHAFGYTLLTRRGHKKLLRHSQPLTVESISDYLLKFLIAITPPPHHAVGVNAGLVAHFSRNIKQNTVVSMRSSGK
jgi:hypothetical protein